MPNPYDTYEKASQGTGIAGAAAGANGGIPNPMGGVQNAQMAYHMHQYGKIVSQPGPGVTMSQSEFPLTSHQAITGHETGSWKRGASASEST